ncbi:hypothetical protein [Nostoc commune]|uniref:hypothetical protein n=1 Tax=Nostoc commune TaxID=1178 RepID=UPI0018C61A0E|nr:hypothetical protein [Nostoc commune]
MADNQLVGTLPVIPLEPNQLNLFPEVKPTPALLTEGLVMSVDALLKWKAQIFDYQHRVRENKPPEQVTLFDFKIQTNYSNGIRVLKMPIAIIFFAIVVLAATSGWIQCLTLSVLNATAKM